MDVSESIVPIRKVVCLGAGYVGGPTMAIMADQCGDDIQFEVFDVNAERIKAWNSNDLPIYEEGLYEAVVRSRGRNLSFRTDDSLDESIADADVIFICVNTPTKTYGRGAGGAADLSYWELAARRIVNVLSKSAAPNRGMRCIVEKSTVPVQTALAMEKIILSADLPMPVEVLSNPEFLAEGRAVQDLLKPDRVLIGGRLETVSGRMAVSRLSSLYERFVPKDRILTSRTWSAELSKLAANAMLAQRVSSINSLSAICDRTGANVDEVARAIGTDSRIGSHFLSASVGFGGSCFEKDIRSLVYICESLNLGEVAQYWKGVVAINNFQRRRFVETIVKTLFNTLRDKRIAILGFAFKAGTGDTRESSSIYVCRELLKELAILQVYDPKVPHDRIKSDLLMSACSSLEPWEYRPVAPTTAVPDAWEKLVRDNVLICNSLKDAVQGVDALIVLTEWPEFASISYKAIRPLMKKPPRLFDGRGICDVSSAKEADFEVYSVGRPSEAAGPFI